MCPAQCCSKVRFCFVGQAPGFFISLPAFLTLQGHMQVLDVVADFAPSTSAASSVQQSWTSVLHQASTSAKAWLALHGPSASVQKAASEASTPQEIASVVRLFVGHSSVLQACKHACMHPITLSCMLPECTSQTFIQSCRGCTQERAVGVVLSFQMPGMRDPAYGCGFQVNGQSTAPGNRLHMRCL